VFVFESSPAQYFPAYGSGLNVTPVLQEHAGHSIVFENFYAHAPATNLSMVSMLTSIYPMLSYKSITEEHPEIKIPDLSQVLNSKGYRTAFFNSADNRFQRGGEFLSCRKFDCISDCKDKRCSDDGFIVKNKKWDFMDGRNDLCTAEQLCNWIDQDKAKPFFSLMWTYQTHYPYFFEGEQEKFSNDSVFNRYLNALKYGDRSLGKIISYLEENNLFESTLLVVLGDHGEAFGQHDQITHASRIYEENIHIPLILVNPLFKAQRKKETGGLVDLAPTITYLLGLHTPSQWQGEDLFEKKENSKAYFFSPWSEYLFGYREGKHKFIFNAANNESELYDLENDPHEEHNLLKEKKEIKELAHLKLAAWTQYVNSNFEKLLSK
jgi:arylsulfatase A-like enzyme